MGFTFISASAALLVAAAAEPPPSLADFEAAMSRFDYRSAARTADSMASRHRLQGREARPDPLLNGLVGRLYLRAGLPAPALNYLRRSDSGDIPAPQRIAAGFARAEAEEALGDWPAAAAAFERLLSLPLDRSGQADARIGLARVRLADDPAGALADASSAAAEAPAGRRWEAELVSSQALSLLGRRAEAESAAGRAWSASAEGRTADAAPMRVALVRAGLAAAAGRREPLLAMLSAANAGINGIASGVAEAVPVCGEGGITPADHAVFAAYTRTDSIQWLTPVSASRPAAAAVFRKAIAGRELLAVTGAPPGGLVFTLRCRTLPSADYVPGPAGDAWTEWFADRGLYFPMAADNALGDINRLAEEIATLAERFGDDHPSIIPLRLTLMDKLVLRAAEATDVSPGQVSELRRKIGAAFAKAGGTEALVPDPQTLAEWDRLEKAGAFEESTALFRQAQERLIANMSAPRAYAALRDWLKVDKDLPAATRRRLFEALLARLGSGRSDPIRRTLLRGLAAISRQSEDVAAVRAANARAGLPRDSCSSAETMPTTQEHGMSDEDYPPDALDPAIPGVAVLEFDVGADGRLAGSRTILAAPSLVFDSQMAAELPGFRYAPATERGRPLACRALQQTIRWRMPEESAPEPPQFLPPMEAES
ncbi:MAG TPA: hypothetical protein VF645_03635 [Allosphingosinicella sp.]|jgi:hypothetical protein